jgi:hypothetical protein
LHNRQTKQTWFKEKILYEKNLLIKFENLEIAQFSWSLLGYQNHKLSLKLNSSKFLQKHLLIKKSFNVYNFIILSVTTNAQNMGASIQV